ncbi:QcrA and Rieske domain-containing protein [Runella slithyformis]|uniref:Rieske (2Fe-2S) iron-sulfur domain protein n=1 Tax=Runella slithyformis (strain ATCC 29530 / DSM 19594 / LMG 11500 / NCIMB 11436 / LSU 4) TaxID=761193 RepID=A0A7U3ZQI2_RUNSL|nr:Rieske (2Fe-2S) protein [Runella slithyformis]AEI51481.1 Rieske (2Fe-2S) iron-sulfur domain protein [Runella slithyformis DSM 19594]
MKQTTIKRGQFLRELGLSSGALMAFYCLGTTMTACSSGSEDPTPVTPGTGTGTAGLTGNADTAKGAINFTLDLTNSTYLSLKTAGSFVTVGSVIVANAKGTMVALSKACTHQGTTVTYRSAQNDFFCSNHGSEFSTTGAVEVGPATKALTLYTAKLSADGNSLTVSA